MKPLEILDSAVTPDGRTLTLQRRDRDYSIGLNGGELMSTRSHGSESALAEAGCEGLARASRPRVLVGGLGLGFTLRAALQRLPEDAEVVVAEFFEAVVRWNREYLAEPDRPLEDARVRVQVGDVAELIAGWAREGFDAILLDVDNGPEAWTLDSNDGLYRGQGIARARQALKPGGVLAVWSAGPDEGYASRLREGGFAVHQVRARARRRKGARHTIFVARREGC